MAVMQDFLDNVCTDIVHLDMKKLQYYRGNYSEHPHLSRFLLLAMMGDG
jgi:hypothetical protein